MRNILKKSQAWPAICRGHISGWNDAIIVNVMARELNVTRMHSMFSYFFSILEAYLKKKRGQNNYIFFQIKIALTSKRSACKNGHCGSGARGEEESSARSVTLQGLDYSDWAGNCSSRVLAGAWNKCRHWFWQY